MITYGANQGVLLPHRKTLMLTGGSSMAEVLVALFYLRFGQTFVQIFPHLHCGNCTLYGLHAQLMYNKVNNPNA